MYTKKSLTTDLHFMNFTEKCKISGLVFDGDNKDI